MDTFMRTKFQVGKCYHVKFLDHCVGYDDVVEVNVVGYVYDQDEKQVKLTHWKENHPKWVESIEKTIIVKSTIITKRKLDG